MPLGLFETPRAGVSRWSHEGAAPVGSDSISEPPQQPNVVLKSPDSQKTSLNACPKPPRLCPRPTASFCPCRGQTSPLFLQQPSLASPPVILSIYHTLSLLPRMQLMIINDN